MMRTVAKGGDRQLAHEKLRVHSQLRPRLLKRREKPTTFSKGSPATKVLT